MLDHELLIERRTALGLSRARLAKRIGASETMIRFAEQGANNRELTLGRLTALADALGVRVGDLFAKPPQDAASSPDDRKVEAALRMVDKGLSSAELTRGLEWDAPRTEHALADLRTRLESSGQLLHLHAGQWYLRPRVALLSPRERRNVEQARFVSGRLSRYDAQVLHAVVTGKADGKWVKYATNAVNVSLSRLLRLQYIEADGAGFRPTRAVEQSLRPQRTTRAPRPNPS